MCLKEPPSLSGETCCEQPGAVSAQEILPDKQEMAIGKGQRQGVT